MIEILIILLTLSVINICVFMKCMTDLKDNIAKLEKKIDKKIDSIQYQIDGVLCYINIMNGNVLNTYGMLNEMKNDDENNTI